MKAAPLALNNCRHFVPKEDPGSLFFPAKRGFSPAAAGLKRRDSSFRRFFMLQNSGFMPNPIRQLPD
jgi:hypothetical protein